MHFKTLLILILIGFNTGLKAQKPNIIPPSPNAAGISKFGDIPVNLSTGLANISIPIYSVKDGSLNWNISLDYNYTGYRPSDGPGWAGRGFQIPIGVITRTVHGLRDEGENGNEGFLTTGSAVNTSVTAAENSTAPDFNFLNAVANGIKDGEPDMFQFSFGSYAGKFFFKPDGSIYSGGSNALKITYETGTPSFTESSQQVGYTFTKWTITTEDGTRYIFNAKEFGWTLFGNEAFDHFKTTISAWHLSEIIGVNGEHITFAYSTPSYTDKRLQASYTQKKTLQIPGGGGPPNYFVNSSTGGLVKNYSQERYPTTISGGTWQINFNSTLMQETINSETSSYRQLNSIDLLDKTSGSAVQIKKFDFTYATSNAHTLEKLTEKNGAISINPYVFTYFNLNEVGPTSSVDYWGYYNASGNSGLISELGADRQPYLPESRMGALQALTYPTLGSSVFEYELNTASYVETSSYRKEWVVYDYYGFVWRKTENGLEVIQPQDPTYSFTIPEERTFESNLGFDFAYDPPCHPVTASGTLLPGTYTAANFTPHPCFAAETPLGGEIDIQIIVKRILILDINPVGGLRIKTIKNYTAPGVLATQKEFKYNLFGVADRSSGALADSIETSSLYTAVFPNNTRATAQTWKSDPFNSLALAPILYQNVEEITNNTSQYHYFSGFVQYSDVEGILMSGGGTQSFGPVGNYDFARGMPIQTTRFRDNTHTAISTESAASFGVTTEKSPGVYLEIAAEYSTPTSGTPDPITQHAYYVKGYRSLAGWIKKESSTERDYGTSGYTAVTTGTTYEYANPAHRLLTKQRITQSDGSIEETNYKYPLEYDIPGKDASIQAMISAHILSYPLEEVSWIEKPGPVRTRTDANLTTYQLVSGKASGVSLILPYKKFSFNGLNGGVGTFTPYSGLTNEADPVTYRETLQYAKYDTMGNPISVLVNKADKISYLWGYKGQYPVAEIQNVGLTDLTAAMAGTSYEQMSDMTSSAAINTKLDLISAALAANSSIPTFQMSRSLYAPLKGMAQAVDPAGKNLYYDYDALNRLSTVSSNGPSSGVRFSYCYGYAGLSYICDAVSISPPAAPPQLSLIIPGALPVTLVNFKAEKKEKTALLTWDTAEEINSKSFEVQRSLDGKKWVDIGSVDAKGGPSHGSPAAGVNAVAMQYYSFVDGSPAHGENLYRLKMIDRATDRQDETFAYSRIQSLTFDDKTTVYPNPVVVGQKLNIDTPGTVTQVKIYDVRGNVLYSQDKPASQIDISSLQSGSYIVQITTTDGLVTTHRIVKQ